MEVHPPHHPLHTWKDFWIHLGTITIGLLIAISLEQSVEALHHRHQRHQLQEDLHDEAERNRDIIQRDLSVQQEEAWFEAAVSQVAGAKPQGGKVSFSLPLAPCSPGTVGTAEARYFAPSEAVWTTAKESGQMALLPAELSRIHQRLGHNYQLLGVMRDHVADGCDAVAAMQRRFSVTSADGKTAVWTMTSEQAEKFADQASTMDTATRGLVLRLRWTLAYEDAIARGDSNVDQVMMKQSKSEP